ncbi:MAG: hypothetical protein LCI00_17030 [Chloroflexi bacterium]|nr:hypothetical protein [Chloroflexota bacterium]
MSDPRTVSHLTLPGNHSRIETWVRFQASPPPVTTVRPSCLDNPATLVRRQLRDLLPDTPTDVCGVLVTYKFSRNVSRWYIAGVGYSLDDALALLTTGGDE